MTGRNVRTSTAAMAGGVAAEPMPQTSRVNSSGIPKSVPPAAACTRSPASVAQPDAVAVGAGWTWPGASAEVQGQDAGRGVALVIGVAGGEEHRKAGDLAGLGVRHPRDALDLLLERLRVVDGRLVDRREHPAPGEDVLELGPLVVGRAPGTLLDRLLDRTHCVASASRFRSCDRAKRPCGPEPSDGYAVPPRPAALHPEAACDDDDPHADDGVSSLDCTRYEVKVTRSCLRSPEGYDVAVFARGCFWGEERLYGRFQRGVYGGRRCGGITPRHLPLAARSHKADAIGILL